MSNIVFGIDPDLVKSGTAVVIDGVIKDIKSMAFPELVGFAEDLRSSASMSGDVLTVIMEDPEVNKPIFNRVGVKGRALLKVAQNVGQVKAAARLIAEMLESKGIFVIKVKPVTGHAKRAKKDAKFFNEITGWSGRSNEDCRDAAIIAIFSSKSKNLET